MPFKEVLEFLQSKDLTHLAPSVARLKILDQKALLEIDAATLTRHEWDPTDITLLLRATGKELPVEQTPLIPVPRSDFPNSSQASQASLWNTWTTLTTAWGLPPIPITRELLLSVGASMKHAGYRSHKNYFYKAAQVHRETLGQDIPPDLHLLMQKILRSIKRGQGPTPFKDAFELELFHAPLQRRLDIIRSGDWFNDRFAARDITLIACWWMLRGIEAAAARFQHIWFHETNLTRFVYFTLPVQKNDPTGLCVTRGHPCTCKTGEPNALCPFHAMQRHMKRINHLFRNTPSEHLPLIPTDAGEFATKAHIMKIFSSAIGLTDTPLTRPGPRGEPLPRFGEHVCRVSEPSSFLGWDIPWKPYNWLAGGVPMQSRDTSKKHH